MLTVERIESAESQFSIRAQTSVNGHQTTTYHSYDIITIIFYNVNTIPF